jgi:trans-aconitate methyltransferase
VRETIELSTTAGDTVLEIGCGPGGLLAQLASDHPDNQFVGVDLDKNMIEHARASHQYGNLRYELADFVHERPSVLADFAYGIDVLHHVHGLPAFLEGVHQVLRPGAIWLAIEPNVFHPYIYWSQARMRRSGLDEDHFRPWVAEAKLRDAGFGVKERRYAFLFPGFVQRVPKGLARIESTFERFRPLGGSVVYLLERLAT